jgi:hypothetical protein
MSAAAGGRTTMCSSRKIGKLLGMHSLESKGLLWDGETEADVGVVAAPLLLSEEEGSGEECVLSQWCE